MVAGQTAGRFSAEQAGGVGSGTCFITAERVEPGAFRFVCRFTSCGRRWARGLGAARTGRSPRNATAGRTSSRALMIRRLPDRSAAPCPVRRRPPPIGVSGRYVESNKRVGHRNRMRILIGGRYPAAPGRWGCTRYPVTAIRLLTLRMSALTVGAVEYSTSARHIFIIPYLEWVCAVLREWSA